MFAIPKIVHMIWIGPQPPPWPAIDTWRIDFARAHPDWSVQIWRELEIDGFGLVNREAYDSRTTYVGRSDVARYEIVARLGGVYIDADSVWLGRPMDALLDRAAATGFFGALEGSPDLVVAGFFGSVAGHPLLETAVELVPARIRALVGEPDWIVTGPALLGAAHRRVCAEHGPAIATLVPFDELVAKSWRCLDRRALRTEIDSFRQHGSSISYQLGWTTNRLTVGDLNQLRPPAGRGSLA